MNESAERATADELRERVKQGYAAIASDAAGGCCGPRGGCGVRSDAAELAQAIGYDAHELAALPEGANLGLSCGNPGALAGLRAGEVVLDIGSGAGFDCFLIGPKVGPRGRAIGVDMTGEMLARARHNAARYRERSGLDNVEFRLGEIEHLPVADRSIDVVISNCVINLSPDKPQVWREIGRVLAPGGRVAISDIVLLRALPEAARHAVEALVGCVAGAELLENTERFAREAGLAEFAVELKHEYLDAMERSRDPLYEQLKTMLPAGTRPSDFVASAEITARKPRVKSCC
ncbi:MAG: arsenite methyltransferase [Planctomycetes bacterium]|nr:arsenite methyltransferase [Planctomycetota bacterium]